LEIPHSAIGRLTYSIENFDMQPKEKIKHRTPTVKIEVTSILFKRMEQTTQGLIHTGWVVVVLYVEAVEPFDFH
jgi:hypothetical protein